MEHDINLGFFWKALKKCWILMIAVAVVAALFVGIFVNFIPKKYSSSVEFYVVNTNTSYDYTTSALLAASSYLINDYVELIKSDVILNDVADAINEGRPEKSQVTPNQLRGMISASSSDNTSLFTITVTSTNPEFAYEVAKTIEQIAPQAVTDIAKPDRLTNDYLVEVAWQTLSNFGKSESVTTDDIEYYLKDLGLDGSLPCFTTVNAPVVDKTADSPDTTRYIGLATMGSAAFIYCIFLIKGFFDTNVSSEDDIKKYVKSPLIGAIPHWEKSSKK
ncbi:MAG: hypothetical protein IJ011_01990 [Clostridia bacterium]|nr:hypothetical protein [Clostridia bacterium]